MKECSKCRHCFDDNQHSCPLDDAPLVASITINLIINDRYILDKRLGKGGMGIVFKAKHKFLKSSHAIKVILPSLVQDDDALLVRFNQEAVLAASINHPNVIKVTDFGIEDGIMPYLVMEFIDGDALSSFLTPDEKIPVQRAFDFFKPIALGVGEAHRQGIVHRDLKPQNIMVQKGLPLEKAVKVLDFGLAKIKSTDNMNSLIQAQTLSVIGSPPYMSPEQWENDEVDHQTDIYALGVLLYQMLTGRLPYKGESIPSIMYQHLTAQPPSFESLGVDVSPEIEAVVKKSLEKESNARYKHIEDMLEDFQNAIDQNDFRLQTGADTAYLAPEYSSDGKLKVANQSDDVSRIDAESLSRTQKERLSEYFDSSEQDKVLADTQLAQEFLHAKDRIVEAEEKVSEADKLVHEFAEAQQFAQDAQRKAIEAKQKIEQEVRRQVEAEMGDKIALEKQAQQKAEAERLAKEAEARRKAEEEAKRLAQVALEAQQQAEAARRKAEEEIHQRELHEDVRIQAENAALQLAEQVSDAKRKYEEAQKKAAYESQLRAAAEEKRQRIEGELQAIAEHEAERRKKAEAEVQRLIQEHSSRYEQEALAAQQTIEDAKRLAELEAKKREEAENAKKVAEMEAQRLAEEMRRVKAHIEEIKQHTSQTTEESTISFQDMNFSSPQVSENIPSMHTSSDANDIQKTVDSLSIPIQQTGSQSIDQQTVPSSHNISQETGEFQNPANSNENISGLLNTNPIPNGGFPVLKVLIGVFSLFFILVIGSIGIYFIAFRDSGVEKPPVANNKNTQKDADQPKDSSEPTEKVRVLIEGGSFEMGRDDVPPTDPMWGLQYPAHTETVDSFVIDKKEVTNAEYLPFVKETKRQAPSNWVNNMPPSGAEKLPVTYVSFGDAQAYALWVSNKENKDCRLPTEQEWEFAARNGSQSTIYPWGNEWQPDFANVGTNKVSEVGITKDISLTGEINDLLGNVLEWTSSKYGLYKGHPTTLQEMSQELYVVRGSFWGEISSNLKKPEWLLTNRQFFQPEQKGPYLGFRLVCKP